MVSSKRSWRAWIEPWYFSFALIGLIVAGLLPVLIPLMAGRGGDAGQVGLVMAAVSLGGLTSPLWGGLADKYRLHRALLLGGMLVTALGLALLAFTSSPSLWFVLATLQGFGAASAATVANLFVVEAHPREEWDERIGWLQTFYGLGQVSGLLLAGYFAGLDIKTGLLAAAALSVAAGLLGWFTTRTPPKQTGADPVLTHPARHTEMVFSSPQRLFNGLDLSAVESLGGLLVSPFGGFLLMWLLAFAGPAAVFSQYPILMQKLYGVTPQTSSLAFAIIAALGLMLYTPAGSWSERQGPQRILQVSLLLRLLAFAGLLGLSLLGSGVSGLLALATFGLVVWAWSLMSVSGTALAARLSPIGEGQGLGIFNAVTAVAGVLGAVLGGWAAGLWGYSAILVMALVGVIIGLTLSFWTRSQQSAQS